MATKDNPYTLPVMYRDQLGLKKILVEGRDYYPECITSDQEVRSTFKTDRGTVRRCARRRFCCIGEKLNREGTFLVWQEEDGYHEQISVEEYEEFCKPVKKKEPDDEKT